MNKSSIICKLIAFCCGLVALCCAVGSGLHAARTGGSAHGLFFAGVFAIVSWVTFFDIKDEEEK